MSGSPQIKNEIFKMADNVGGGRTADITPETIDWLKRMQGNAVEPMYSQYQPMFNQGLLSTSNMPQSYGNNVQSMFQGYKGE